MGEEEVATGVMSFVVDVGDFDHLCDVVEDGGVVPNLDGLSL